MVGLAQSESLDEQRKLLEIAEELIKGIRGLEGNVEQLGRHGVMPTVREWFDRTLEEMTNGANGDDRQLKAASVERIQNVHNHWLQYLAGLQVNLADAPLPRIGPDEVRGYLAMKKAAGFSGSTRRYALARIRSVFGRAVDRGLIASNPAGSKQLGRLKFDDKSIRRAFNARQIAAILGAADASPDGWLKLSALLGLFTGQRVGDICSMRWEDIRDFDGLLPTISVTQQKTGSYVVMPIAEPLREALRMVPEDQRSGYLLGHVAEAYLKGRRRRFIRAWRSLLEGAKLSSLTELPVEARVERSGIKGRCRYAWTFHSWRHTTATYLSGPDAHYLLGHRGDDEKRLGTTVQYRHEDLQRLKAALDAIPLSQAENVLQFTANA
jgi:integrase